MKCKKSVFMLTAAALVVCMSLTSCSPSAPPSDAQSPNSDDASVVHDDTGTLPAEGDLSDSTEPRGTTEVFNFRDELEIEVTNVQEVTEGSGTMDNGEPYSYTVYICYPEAQATVLAAGMRDGEFYEDGLPHPEYGFTMLPDENQLRITEEIVGQSMDVSEIKGAFHLEGSTYLLMFEIQES